MLPTETEHFPSDFPIMSTKKGRPRPRLFRALGKHEPPPLIEVDNTTYMHQRTVKHDSWAATAIYSDGRRRVVCKFNRVQPILFIPMKWLGRRLAKRERTMYERLADLPNVPAGCRTVTSYGQEWPNAAAHDYVEGHALRWDDRVDDQFFETLFATLREIHRRDIAYVDMNKWENIIVDEQGAPVLIDFQISVALNSRGPLGWLLKILQKSDIYHLQKHARRIRPDLYADQPIELPWWIKAHRCIANPFRKARRKLLVWLGVRKGSGKPQSERFVELGLRHVGDHAKPIARLYQILESREYQDSARGRGDFATVAFQDLLDRQPDNEDELSYLRSLRKMTSQDQIIWMLKSPVFFESTNNWDDDQIESVIRRITSIASGYSTAPSPQHRSAA